MSEAADSLSWTFEIPCKIKTMCARHQNSNGLSARNICELLDSRKTVAWPVHASGFFPEYSKEERTILKDRRPSWGRYLNTLRRVFQRLRRHQIARKKWNLQTCERSETHSQGLSKRSRNRPLWLRFFPSQILKTSGITEYRLKAWKHWIQFAMRHSFFSLNALSTLRVNSHCSSLFGTAKKKKKNREA